MSGKEPADLLQICALTDDVGGEGLSGPGSEGLRGDRGVFSFLENFIISCPK